MSGGEVLAAISFAVVIVGSILPWARSTEYDYPGTSGEGLYTLVLGVVALGIVLIGRGKGITWLAVVAGGVAMFLALYAVSDIQEFAERAGLGIRDPDPEMAPGVVITLVASLVGSFALLSSQSNAVPQPPQAPEPPVDSAE